MNLNNEIIKVINDNLMKNSEFEVVSRFKNLTLLDIFALMNTSKTRGEL